MLIFIKFMDLQEHVCLIVGYIFTLFLRCKTAT